MGEDHGKDRRQRQGSRHHDPEKGDRFKDSAGACLDKFKLSSHAPILRQECEELRKSICEI